MPTIQTGLVSVTFRALAPQAILDLVARAGLGAVEWGGDVHVQPGDVATAREVCRMTLDAGLQIPSYGSYYRAGHDETGPFAAVLESAVALGAPVIRVWAGRQGSAQADAIYWDRVVSDSRRIAGLAEAEGLRIAYEYHGNTLTDTDDAALRLLRTVDHHAVGTYWQRRDGEFAKDLAGLRAVLPWLVHVHVQASAGGARLPLDAMAAEWRQALAIVAETGRSHTAMIEFVKDDTPEQFLADAAVLRDDNDRE